MSWVVYVGLLALCVGAAEAFRIQFSRNIVRKEVVAALALIATGILGLGVGIVYLPL